MDCNTFDFAVNVVVLGCFSLFGIFANAIVFTVFYRDPKKTATSFLFQALAVADILLLLLCIPMYSFDSLYTHIYEHAGGIWMVRLMYVDPYLKVYVYPLCMMALFVNIWVTVMVGINRYIAVCRPYDASRLCSMWRIRLYTLIIVIVGVCYSIPRYFTATIAHEPVGENLETNTTHFMPYPEYTHLGKSRLFDILYYNISYIVCMFVVPIVTLIILDIKLIRKLRKLQRRRSGMQTREQHQDNNITLVLIVVIIIFIVCQTPAMINHIFWTFLPQDQRLCGKFHYFWRVFSNVLVVINSSGNFVIYLVLNNRFRSLLCQGDGGLQAGQGNQWRNQTMPTQQSTVPARRRLSSKSCSAAQMLNAIHEDAHVSEAKGLEMRTAAEKDPRASSNEKEPCMPADDSRTARHQETVVDVIVSDVKETLL